MKKITLLLFFSMTSIMTFSQSLTDKWTSNHITQSGDDELIDIAVNTELINTQAGSVASISRSFNQNQDTGNENEIRIDYHDEDGTLEWSNTDVVGDGIPVRVFIDGGSVMGVSNFDIGQTNSGMTFHGYTFSGTRKTGYPRSYSTTAGVVIADATIVDGIIHAVGYIDSGPSNKNMILVRSQISNTSGTIYTATYGDSNEDEIGRAIAGTSTHSFSLVEDGDIMRVLKFNNSTGTSTPEVTRSYTVSNANYGGVVGIKALDENNVFAVFEEDGDYILKKYDLLSSYSGEFDTRITDLDDVRDFYVDASGNTYLTGYDGLKLFLAKYNSSGVRQYLVNGSPAIGSSGSSIFANDDGTIAVVGSLSVASVNSPGVIVFDTDGTELLLHQYDENSGTASILKGKQGLKNSVVIAREYNKGSNFDSRKLWTICDLPSASHSPEEPIMEPGGNVMVTTTAESGISATWDHNSSPSALFSTPGYYTYTVGYSGTQFNCDNVVSVLVRSNQTISFSSLPSKTTLDDDFTLTASSTSELDIEYTSSDPSVATISGNTVSIVGAGSTTITAAQSGTALYTAASSVQRTLNVSKVSQTLDWSMSSPITITQLHLNETQDKFTAKTNIETNQGNKANSLVSSDPSIVSIEDGGTAWLLDYKKAGTVTLTATVDADDNYLSVSDDVEFSLVKTDQAIAMSTPITERTLGEDAFDVSAYILGSANSNSGNPIVITSDNPNIVSVSGVTVTIVGVGTTWIRANQAGSELYNPADEVTLEINVLGAPLFVWDGSSWDQGSTPDIGDDVKLNAPLITASHGTFNANSLEVSSSAFLRVSTGHTLEVMGDVVVNGEMIIESGASLITYEGYSISDDIYFSRNTRYSDGKYSFVGSPVNQDGSITGSDLGSSVYKYNENIPYGSNEGLGRWLDAADDELVPGVGYTQASQKEIVFEGVPNTGTITYTGTYTEDANDDFEGWSLVSNPYPAAISVTSFLSENTNIQGAVYIWDDNGSHTERGANSDYIVANGIAATSTTPAGSENRYNKRLGSAQGFFVKLMDNTDTNITFTEAMRIEVAGDNDDANFFRKAALPIIRVNLTDNQGLFKQTVISIVEDATSQSLNRMYDAKAFNAASDYGLFTLKAGRSLSLNGIYPDWEYLQLQFNAEEAGPYQISVDLEGYDSPLYLRDKLTDEVIDLSNESYSFVSQPGVHMNRFELLSNSASILTIDKDDALIYAFEKVLHIAMKVPVVTDYQLYTLSGKYIRGISADDDTTINLSYLPDGIYILFDGVKSKKILLK